MRRLWLIAISASVGCYTGANGGTAGAGAPTQGASGASGDDAGSGSGGETDGPSSGTGDDPSTGGDGLPPEGAAAPSGLRRLTRGEYDNTIADLLGDDTRPATNGGWPEEHGEPFLNDYRAQIASAPLVEGAERLAADVADRLIADPVRLAALMPCTPSEVGEEACLRELITSFGRRAFRRPLEPEEVDGFASLLNYAVATDTRLEADFDTTVGLVLRAILQDVNFLYRIEVGTELDDRPGVFHLSDYEVATRLSYLVWGSAPDDELLDLAGAGLLGSPDQRAEAMQWMLEDDRALARVDEFHAQWIGYQHMVAAPDLKEAMRTETRALLQRAIFESGNYLELFTSDETYIESDVLAQHYGIELAVPGWTQLEGTGRGGLLGQGSFLTAHNNFDDTSPVKRGVFVREWLMCQPIPPPPPEVADEVPEATSESPCKVQRLKEIHHAEPTCAACHVLVDTIGFGLEAYDKTGRFRTAESDNPNTEDVDETLCTLDGEGDLTGYGTFNGPGELGDLLAESGTLDACIVKQAYRFVAGRPSMQDGSEDEMLDELAAGFAASDHDFANMLIEMARRDEFVLRTEDQEE